MKKLGNEEKDKNIKLDIQIRKKVLEYMKKEKFFKYSNKNIKKIIPNIPKKKKKLQIKKDFDGLVAFLVNKH